MIRRLNIKLEPDKRRVICLPLTLSAPGEMEQRTKRIFENIIKLDQKSVQKTYDDFMNEFAHRHKSFNTILEDKFNEIKPFLPADHQLSKAQRFVLASYFVMEYALEAAALFNPSMVVHPIQDKKDRLKILLSLRATGEGHISSIEFVEGYISHDGNVELSDRGVSCHLAQLSAVDIEKSVLEFNDGIAMNERVIFPLTKDESNGIEDVRFVRFDDENNEKSYYGTFTAFDGKHIKSKLIFTRDFKKFTIHSMSGSAINDKGMALFPQKINGKYVMISRQDGENIRIMYSDDILHWEHSEIIQAPEFPWQLGKLGNCGSPIELDEGWLLLVHGVGPIRKYVIGAYLLDKSNPAIVLKRTIDPILYATDEEREGYVPNVVYSCGGICHQGKIYIPFAISDMSSGMVSVSVEDLLNSMQ